MRTRLLQSILTQLQTLSAVIPLVVQQARTDKIYEVFVLTSLLRALREIGAQLEVRDADDQPTGVLWLRLSPGLLNGPMNAAGFVLVEYNDNKFEIHSGLRVGGYSSVLHELDVSIIERSDAMECREKKENPEHWAVKALIECKFYGSKLPLSVGRQHLGLIDEFGVPMALLCANSFSSRIEAVLNGRYSQRARGFRRVYFDPDLPWRNEYRVPLVRHFMLSPLNEETEDRFVGWLAEELRHVLG